MTMNIEGSNLQNKAFPNSNVVYSSEKLTAAVEQTILQTRLTPVQGSSGGRTLSSFLGDDTR